MTFAWHLNTLGNRTEFQWYSRTWGNTQVLTWIAHETWCIPPVNTVANASINILFTSIKHFPLSPEKKQTSETKFLDDETECFDVRSFVHWYATRGRSARGDVMRHYFTWIFCSAWQETANVAFYSFVSYIRHASNYFEWYSAANDVPVNDQLRPFQLRCYARRH